MKRERNLPSAGGLAAIDVEDMAGDERSLVRGDEDDRVGEFLREAEAAHRNTVIRAVLFSGVPVKRVSMPVSVGPGATLFTRIPDLAISSATDLVMPSTACLLPA